MTGPHGEGIAGGRLLAAGTGLVHDIVAVEVTAELGAAGIRAILLKGSATTRLLAADASELRLSSDVDVLVAPHDFTAAEAVLRARGMTPVEHDDPRRHSRAWIGGQPRAAVDLHRRISGVEAHPEAAWEILTADTDWLETGFGPLETLSETGRVLHLALHARNDRGGQPLDDLQRALELMGTTTWRAVADLAERLDCTPAFAFALRRSARGRTVAEDLGLPTLVTPDLALHVRDDPALTLYRILETPGTTRRLGMIARRMLPSPRVMRAQYPVARRGAAGLGFAYLQRAFCVVRALPAALSTATAARRAPREGGDG